jgi:hypothetical protein
VKINLDRFPIGFKNTLIKSSSDYGFQIVEENNEADVRIIIDPINKENLCSSKDIVVLVEPETVRPDLYRKSFLKKFPNIMALGKYRAERLGLKFWIEFPVELPKYVRQDLQIKNKFAIVNENKFSSSPRSQYGLRRKVISYFEENMPQELDLFGREWNAGKQIELRRRVYALRNRRSLLNLDFPEVFGNLWKQYDTFVGPMESDCEQLQNYKASITIENDLDYVSEKVWKSLYAGCPVIYVGPGLTYDPELEKCLLIAESNLKSVVSKISEINDLSQILRLNLKEKGLDFIHSANFNKYSNQTTAEVFFNTLRAKLMI